MKWRWFHLNAIGIFALIVTLGLFLFVTRSAYQSGDSLNYAVSARTGGPEMFHPQHLIFASATHLLHYVVAGMFPDFDILTTGQIHNIAWAIVTLVSVYLIVLYLTHTRPLALWASVLIFATQGFLTFTTWFEAYVPALGCLALLTAVLVCAHSGHLSRPRLALLIGLLSLAILYHQMNVLIVFPVGVYFALSPERRFRDYIALTVSSGMIVILLYVIAYLSCPTNQTFVGFVRFCFRYVLHPNPTWGTWANVSSQGVRNMVDSQVWNIAPLPGNIRLSIALMIMFVLGWNIIRIVTDVEWRAVRSFLILWICIYYLFSLWWLPGYRELFFVTMFPLLLIGTMTLCNICALLPSRVSKILPAIVLASLSALLLIRNIPVLRDNHAKKGEAYEQARLLSESVNDETMIMTDYVTQQNLRFYFGSHQTEEIVIPALCFYQHLPLPMYCESAMNGVCLLEVRDITPNHSVYGFDAYSHPSEWLAFLDWLFAFKYDSSGDVMSCRDIECRALCAGPVSILIKCTRRNVVGLKDLFGKLDQAIGSAANNRDQAFDDWLRRISATKKRTIQEMAQSRAISCQ